MSCICKDTSRNGHKNPQWSLSCLLALLLPLNGLQAEVTGMVETNVLDNQLQKGQEEMPTLIGAINDSSVVDVTLEEGEQEQETRQQETRLCSTRTTEKMALTNCKWPVPCLVRNAHGTMFVFSCLKRSC